MVYCKKKTGAWRVAEVRMPEVAGSNPSIAQTFSKLLGTYDIIPIFSDQKTSFGFFDQWAPFFYK